MSFSICEDEVPQALGRGRAANFTADNLPEVHLLADVVLPITYSLVQAQEPVCKAILRQGLVVTIAADSPNMRLGGILGFPGARLGQRKRSNVQYLPDTAVPKHLMLLASDRYWANSGTPMQTSQSP